MTLPKEITGRVSRRVFADLEAIGWDGLTGQEKAKQYNRWAEDPEIGGVLRQFQEDPRHWIKDTPVKEWPRARLGIGSFAEYLDLDEDPIGQIVRLGLGPDWSADNDSVVIKPLRVTAHHRLDRHDPVVVTWAPAKDFKHILWAALQADAKGDQREWVLLVLDPLEKPVPADVRVVHERIARRCGFRVVHREVG